MAKDIIPFGTKLGRLTLMREMPRRGEKRVVECSCDCGKVITALWQNLKRGATLSCGCYAKDVNTIHGASRTRLFQIWSNMQARCSKPNRADYQYYGGQGISVCKEWSYYDGFAFWAVQNGYSHDLTIERHDVTGNYEPSNCYWANMNVQAANKKKRVNSKAPYIGVYAVGRRWAATICSYDVRTHLGVHDTPEQARDARNDYIRKNQLPHTLS